MKRLLAPLWYPPEPNFAGGFYRSKRILESIETWSPYVIASDTFPLDAGAIQIHRYPSRLLAGRSALFKVMRVLNWMWSTLAIIVLGLRWREKFDIVYGGPSEILPISLGALVIGKIRRIPVVLCNFNVRDTELWALNRLVHNRADAIITLSDALAEELRREDLNAPIYIGATGVDDFSVPPREIQFDGIFVGRHTEAKGIFDLLRAWRLVCDSRPDARLACIGSITPHLEVNVRLAQRSLRLEENVTFLGPLSEREKWEAYASSRFCVFPSLVEGWGIVPIEAQLAGLPVVAYDLPAYAGTIAQSPGATLVPVGDVAGVAGAALKLFENDDVDRLALRTWAKRFTWSAAAAQEERILLEVESQKAK